MSSLLRPVIPVFLLLLLLLPGTACAWELRLTESALDQSLPAVSGSTVVWQQDNGNGDFDIYLWDGMTGETRRLTDEPAKQWRPQIAGHWVVWEDYRNGNSSEKNPDIYLLDLETGNESMVNSPIPIFGGYECTPAISTTVLRDGRTVPVVTWIESAAGISEQGRVFFRYMDGTAVYRQAYQDSNTQTKPWVSGEKVVWTDTDLGGVYFRYLRDDSGSDATRVLERMSNESINGLRISGDRIVWSQYMPENWAYNTRICELNIDLQNGTKWWLSPREEKFQTDPAIDGDLVVWSDERAGQPDIYLYDLATDTERPLVTASGDQMQTAIDGEIVAYTDTRNGNRDIYLTGARETTPLPGTTTLEGAAGPPGDPGGDGLLEDANGNGRADFADVVLYFNRMEWIGANEPVWRFDYNGNGRIDFADVVWLFNTL